MAPERSGGIQPRLMQVTGQTIDAVPVLTTKARPLRVRPGRWPPGRRVVNPSPAAVSCAHEPTRDRQPRHPAAAHPRIRTGTCMGAVSHAQEPGDGPRRGSGRAAGTLPVAYRGAEPAVERRPARGGAPGNRRRADL